MFPDIESPDVKSRDTQAIAQTAQALVQIVGTDGVTDNEAELAGHMADRWPLALLWQRAGKTPHQPDLVCWPRTAQQVAAVIHYAQQHQVPVVPFGGGSGVCGGVVPTQGGIALDLKRMAAIRDIRPEALLCEVEAGANGLLLEEALNRRGFTLGHFPSSIACSSVGGWIAARSSGQASTRYGSIEHMVAGLELVLPSGQLATARPVPRTAAGIDWRTLFVGSEGVLGVITKAWLRMHPLPSARRFLCFRFPTLESGLTAIRQVLRRGYRPSVVRLYDPLDTLVGVSGGGGDKGWMARAGKAAIARGTQLLLAHPSWSRIVERAAGRCHAVFVCEGEKALTDLEASVITEEALAVGAEDRGADGAKHWYDHRYDISFKAAPVFADGGFVDTMELAAPWDRIADLYYAVREAIAKHAVTLAHFSHAYTDGVSVYFTFAAATGSPESDEDCYNRIWSEGLAAARARGGTLSHHHGVGLLKGEALREELGPLHGILGNLKATLDPANIMNPGKMGL